MHQKEGKTFGPYILYERIAMGGMAEIFRAQRTGAAGFAKNVVIKRIHSDFCEDDEFVQMFINEANIASLLTHPNIVQVSDFNLHDDTYYIVMEYVEGMDLKSLQALAQRNKQPIPIQLALYIAVQSLKGLAYAHEYQKNGQNLGIVHRDVSPHNILISNRGEVKVTDFGIARIAQSVGRTASGVLKGKAAYMAPEQTRTSQVNHLADVFAMGVVLWELLAQRRLFRADNDILTIEHVRNLKIQPPHTFNPSVSQEVSEITMWALKRPEQARIPNARTFFQRLQPYAMNHGPEEALSTYIRSLRTKQSSPQGTAAMQTWTPPPPSFSAASSPNPPLPTGAPESTPEWMLQTEQFIAQDGSVGKQPPTRPAAITTQPPPKPTQQDAMLWEEAFQPPNPPETPTPPPSNYSQTNSINHNESSGILQTAHFHPKMHLPNPNPSKAASLPAPSSDTERETPAIDGVETVHVNPADYLPQDALKKRSTKESTPSLSAFTPNPTQQDASPIHKPTQQDNATWQASHPTTPAPQTPPPSPSPLKKGTLKVQPQQIENLSDPSNPLVKIAEPAQPDLLQNASPDKTITDPPKHSFLPPEISRPTTEQPAIPSRPLTLEEPLPIKEPPENSTQLLMIITVLTILLFAVVVVLIMQISS